MKKNKAVFLDRDGVLVKNVTYGKEVDVAPRKLSDLKIFENVSSILEKLKNKGYFLVIVSNQPDVALGKINGKTRVALEKHFEKLLKINKIDVDKIIYCYHHPKGIIKKYKIDCECRKPKPGMIFEAAKELNINLKKSFLVGDRASDIKAGKTAGVRTILFDPGNTQIKYLLDQDVKPDYTLINLDDVINIL